MALNRPGTARTESRQGGREHLHWPRASLSLSARLNLNVLRNSCEPASHRSPSSHPSAAPAASTLSTGHAAARAGGRCLPCARFGEDRFRFSHPCSDDGRSDGPVRCARLRIAARREEALGRERCQVGPKDASWLIHYCGNTARKCWRWPNFWANLASFALGPGATAPRRCRAPGAWGAGGTPRRGRSPCCASAAP
jgi:hypothetical protein